MLQGDSMKVGDLVRATRPIPADALYIGLIVSLKKTLPSGSKLWRVAWVDKGGRLSTCHEDSIEVIHESR